MGGDAAEVAETLQYSCGIKMHSLMCTELMKFVDIISKIFPAIESAQPGCLLGIESICSLNQTMEKAKLLLQHCTESSKLYLAITGDAIMLRSERVRNVLEKSLREIQNMVPTLLAAQISAIVDNLKVAKFIMGSSEEVAGKVLLSLLCQGSDSTGASEFEAFQIAASRLHITSPKALLIEKRAIKKLLDKVRDTDQTKRRILNYLLYLLKKYGKSIIAEQTVNDNAQYEGPGSSTHSSCNGSTYNQSKEPVPNVGIAVCEVQVDGSSKPIPREEFRCPISLELMHDPVVIASGQTFERVWIEKWFSDGHDTCPKTQEKLLHLSVTPNSTMKDLISKWCRKHGITIPAPCSQPIPTSHYLWKTSSSSSIASFSSSLNDASIPIYDRNVSFGSSDASSDSSQIKIIDSSTLGSHQMNNKPPICQSLNFRHGMNSDFISELTALPWESKCRAVEDVKNHLKDNEAPHFVLSSSFVELMLRFLKDARDRYDVQAQKVGAQVLLIIVTKSRNEILSLCEDVFHLLAFFIDSEIAEEALAIMQVLSCSLCHKSRIVASVALPSIGKILNSQTRELLGPAVKILSNLSSYSNIGPDILYLGYIQKLISLLSDSLLAVDCIKILKNLCSTDEGRIALAEANGSIASIAELLEIGTNEEKEHAVEVLLTLCSHHFDYCELVLDEGIIPSLVHISINGNSRGKESAMELLRLLRDIRNNDSLENSLPPTGSNPELSCISGYRSTEKQPSLKARGFFRRKVRMFSKPRSLALF